ncbi:hypothetical protein CRYUN_Cryun41cG0060500 [Craigia yunnanensis]
MKGYFFHYVKIVDDLKYRRNELEFKKDRVKNDVDEAIRQIEVIEKDVEDWLTRAEKELREARSLNEEIERKKCFSWCPNWGWRYFVSKKVAKKTLCISKLLETSDFARVGYRAPLQGIEFFPSKDFMPSKSSNSTFNGIIKALNTNGVNMIGLYGMPGVGKTTLAKEVGKHAKEQYLFDKVVMVTMSQTPNVNKMQEKIAELLGLKFEASTEEGKAEELWRRLKDVKKILIIIDDVWNEFELQTIGIPFGVEHDGCKILLTMRLQQVCVRMNCQEKFRLDILSEDEAWVLFKDNAGLKDVSSTLNDVAKKVACKCKGLPLAIVTIGKALKGANLDGWKVANQRLKDSRHLDNEDACEGIYNCLKLSYDYLKGDNIRSCFLLCSLFPEDFHIPIELLIMFGIGYGLFSNIYLVEDLRREIREALRKLQDSGLLLKTDDGDVDNDDVCMHDVVHDFAHWITSRGKNIFMVKEGLTEWPTRESFGCYTAISFWNNSINNFPDKLEFPKLKILVFTRKNLMRIPSAFVKGMKALRVLHLKNVVFSLEVLKFIGNLRTLCLIDCELENISSLRNMKNLEILALLNSNIYTLPEELVALRRLQSLHFSYYGEQQINFPPNLLSRLTSLQELHVTCKNNVNLSELNSLPYLTALSLRVSTDQCLQENFVFPKLQRYNIAVNGDITPMEGLNFRTLKINDLSSLNAFKELFCNVESLVLGDVMEHKNIVPNVDQEVLNELTSLKLRFCKDLECLMDTPPIRFFQKLKDVIIENCERLKVVFQMDRLVEEEEISLPLLSNFTSLVLISLPELESIWKLQPTHQYHASLQSLMVVRIRHCSKLKSIFSTCLAQRLLHLQQVTISYCYGLERVFDFPQEMAELEDPPILLTSKVLRLRIMWCFELAFLFTAPLAQSLVHLEVLEICHCDSLEHVIMEEAENEDEKVSNVEGYSMSWPKLKTLKIINCKSLKFVFPITLAQGLPAPKGFLQNQAPLLSNLTSLELKSLPELKWIWKGPSHYVCLQNLKVAEISRCDRLKYLFSPSFAQTLVLLEQLKIVYCYGLKHIITTELEINDNIESDGGHLTPPLFPKLKTLEISDCPSLKYIFRIPSAQVLPQLKSVSITNSPQLKHVFTVAKVNNGVDCAIALPRLQDLQLQNLKALSCLKTIPSYHHPWKS